MVSSGIAQTFAQCCQPILVCEPLAAHSTGRLKRVHFTYKRKPCQQPAVDVQIDIEKTTSRSADQKHRTCLKTTFIHRHIGSSV